MRKLLLHRSCLEELAKLACVVRAVARNSLIRPAWGGEYPHDAVSVEKTGLSAQTCLLQCRNYVANNSYKNFAVYLRWRHMFCPHVAENDISSTECLDTL